MNIPNNGQFSQRFEENSENFSGSKARGNTPSAPTTQLRIKGMSDVYDMATAKGVPVDAIVTQVMKNSLPEIRGYVTAKGETPLDDTTALCLQAVLLRANDVATVARTLDISDEDALESIEGAESELLSVNSPEKDQVPTVPVQAAMACAMDFMSDKHTGITVGGTSGSGRMGDILSQAKQAGKAWSKVLQSGSKASNFLDSGADASDISDQSDIGDPTIDYSDPNTWAAMDQSGSTDLPATTISSTLATIPAPGVISPAGQIPTISTVGAKLPSAGPATTSGGILNSITSLLSGISQVANGVTAAANSSAGAAGAIKNAVSNVGANSIATYIQNNKGTIILVVILLAFLIFAAVYAAKHSRK